MQLQKMVAAWARRTRYTCFAARDSFADSGAAIARSHGILQRVEEA
jgi:hypothetical protein